MPSYRIICSIAVWCLAASSAMAQGAQPLSWNVVDRGVVGDGATLNTAALQAAVDACAQAGGGTLFFPAGTYLTGTVYLKDHVRIHLDSGALLLGSDDLRDYPVTRCEFPSRSDAYTGRALLWAEGRRGISITGHGTIDGQGSRFRDNRATPEDMDALARAYAEEGRYQPKDVYFNRPYLIRFIGCRDIRVEDVTLQHSAMWMQQYLDCEYVTIRGIRVFNHGCANNDMIDIDCCRYVTIADCVGDSDDDALTLKSTGARPTEHVTVTNCILSSHCNAIKAGTESAGGFKDITISNCVIRRSAVPDGITGRPEGLAGIALEIVDGGSLERVAISNIVIEGTTAPIFLRLGDRARPARPSDPRPPVGTFRDVAISNVVATGASITGCAIAGIPGHPIRDVTLENIRIAFAGGGTPEQAAADPPEAEDQYPESTMFGVLPAYGLFCRHVEGLRIRDVRLRTDRPDARPALVCVDTRDLRLEGFRADASPQAVAQVLLKDSVGAFITGSQADPAGAFVRIEGASDHIGLVGNDLRGATEPISLGETVSPAALRETGNLR